jgi:hypothetical protein
VKTTTKDWEKAAVNRASGFDLFRSGKRLCSGEANIVENDELVWLTLLSNKA